MDIISYNLAAKQQTRIKNVINDPDSTSGLLTVPQSIASGQTITIPAGRTAVCPNLNIVGTLNVNGTLFIPSGSGITQTTVGINASDGNTATITALSGMGSNQTFTLPLVGGSLATTTFVNTSMGNLGTQTGRLPVSFTLTQSNAGKMQMCAGGITVTLPPINTIVSGSCFILKHMGDSPYTPVTIAVNGNSLESVSLKIVADETLILQSDGGSYYRVVSRTGRTPMYDDNNIAITYNTVYQATTDLTLIVLLLGSNINGAEIVVGNTSSPTRVLSQFGDDLNTNTKQATMSAVIPASMYYAVQPYGASAFENISIIAYPHK